VLVMALHTLWEFQLRMARNVGPYKSLTKFYAYDRAEG
jgi:hypothetical protein